MKKEPLTTMHLKELKQKIKILFLSNGFFEGILVNIKDF